MRLRSVLILLLALATGLSVFAYNLWLYSCGSCSMRSLATPSIPGYLLAALNVILVLVWLGLKRQNASRASRIDCPCGSQLLPDWDYCPACGRQRPT
jgi:hypothetical protein